MGLPTPRWTVGISARPDSTVRAGPSPISTRHTPGAEPKRQPAIAEARCPAQGEDRGRQPVADRRSVLPATAPVAVEEEVRSVRAPVEAADRRNPSYPRSCMRWEPSPTTSAPRRALIPSRPRFVRPREAPIGPVGPIPASIDTATLLAHLDAHPDVAESITWTLNLDSTPIYSIRPDGAYAPDAYALLRKFLSEQVDANVRAERVSIPGLLVGTQTLLTGQKVGIVVPVLRGMFNWTIGALVQRAVGKRPEKGTDKGEREAFRRKEEGITNFLQRVYFEIRNLGVEPRDRALNAAATNAFQLERVFMAAAATGLQLDQIDVERSPVCRLDSDCWDVVLYFFNPANVLGEARRAFRFTVDVSDVVPVLIGDIREWSVR